MIFAASGSGKSHFVLYEGGKPKIGNLVDGDIIIKLTIGWPADALWYKKPDAPKVHAANAAEIVKFEKARPDCIVLFNGDVSSVVESVQACVVIPAEEHTRRVKTRHVSSKQPTDLAVVLENARKVELFAKQHGIPLFATFENAVEHIRSASKGKPPVAKPEVRHDRALNVIILAVKDVTKYPDCYHATGQTAADAVAGFISKMQRDQVSGSGCFPIACDEKALAPMSAMLAASVASVLNDPMSKLAIIVEQDCDVSAIKTSAIVKGAVGQDIAVPVRGPFPTAALNEAVQAYLVEHNPNKEGK